MKFVALVSGGKDSVYNIIECVRNGHELVACVHLGAPSIVEEESFMYQTAASEVIPTLVEECLGVPLILYERKGTSSNTCLVYETPTTETDEVEDLYEALVLAKKKFPKIQAVASGAILSTYQRVRIEHVCSRLSLTSLSYLWRIDSQHELLKRMLDDGIVAVLVKTACPPGLVPRKHLNKTLGALYASGLFEKLNNLYQLHMCGEGGEYESLVLDCPIYKKRLVLDEVEIVETDDGVGVLNIKSCHSEEKPDGATDILPRASTETNSQRPAVMEKSEAVMTPRTQYLPHVRRMNGGLLHLSEIMSSVVANSREGASEADLAVEEALAVLHLLKAALTRHGATAQDVLMVHLYLSEISHFALINAHYREFFGTLLPPSRSCVAVGKGELPGGRRVLLDCLVQCGSGQYMRSKADDPYAKAAQLTKTSSLRQVLHVQSISYWAPVCVGPYSQVNTLRSGLHFLAGQIGLVPATMKLRDTWTEQLDQCWTNVARVLDALDGGSLTNLLSGLVYVSDQVCCQGDAWTTVESICRQSIACNSNVVPGIVESTASPDTLYGGYEDEGTWREMTKGEAEHTDLSVPLLFVSIPEMPMGALAEVEAICSTQRAANCLELKSSSHTKDDVWSPMETGSTPAGWDTGHDFVLAHASLTRDVCVNVSTRFMGYRCAGLATVCANLSENAAYDQVATSLDIENLLGVMISSAFHDNFTRSSGLTKRELVHVRLYHIGAIFENGITAVIDDGTRLRTALNSALASQFAADGIENVASSTVVPVQAMKVTSSSMSTPIEGTTVLAMQILIADPVHMENELWICHGRDDND